MFQNYLKIAIRNLVKQKTYSFINIFGLAIGLAGCILIVGYLANELGFENCHKNRDRIYRVQGLYVTPNTWVSMACAVPALAPALQAECPEVESAVRFRSLTPATVEVNREKFDGYKALCASPEIFDIFTLPLVIGDARTALNQPLSAVITENMAKKHFRGVNPIGMTFRLMDSLDCQITGVLKNIPYNTQLGCDFIVSYASLEKMGAKSDSWDELGKDYVYVLLKKNADPKAVDLKLPILFSQHTDKETAKSMQFSLFPLKDIYLKSGMSWELSPRGDIDYVYLFALVAGLILFVASVNFINLTTARTAHRLKEVAMRKILGALRKQLILQFLGESIIITGVAMLLGLMFFEVLKPQLERFLGQTLVISLFTQPILLLSIFAIILVVGIVAGSYPALYLTRFQPVAIFKHRGAIQKPKSALRRILVIFQFTIAIGLIFYTITISRQVHYFRTANLGFDKENIVVLPLGEENVGDRCLLLKEQIKSRCNVTSVTALYSAPGESRVVSSTLKSEDQLDKDAEGVQLVFVDEDYVKTFGLQMLQGRAFSKDFPADATSGVVINEAAVERFVLKTPLGHRFYTAKNQEYRVIGVVKNFYEQTMRNPTYPMFMMIRPNWYRALAVKLLPGDTQAIAQIKKVWEEVLPDIPFKYNYLDDVINDAYNNEQKQASLFSFFALLAISIACLGVFGLSSFTAERRTKEIGIRKVLGATVMNVLTIMSKEFTVLIIIACFIASPIGWYAADKWLGNYANRVPISWWTFALAGLFALLIALVSVSYQAIKAATANPIKALRYE